MTNDERRKKSEARISKCSLWCDRWFRHSDFVIPSDFIIRHSGLRITAALFRNGRRSVQNSVHAIPFQRRKPHSAMKQTNANKNTAERCHSGMVQLSVMGALRFGKLAANESSLFTAMTSPPVCRAIVSSKARFGL